METRPEQPPEGKLIGDAADLMNLSIREAAKRAGISYGRWRQIVTGYQNVSPGSFAPVHAPAKTLARMASVVGVTPKQLTEAGREDAAKILAGLQHSEPAPAAAAGFITLPSLAVTSAEDAAEVTRAVVVAAIGPRLERQVWSEVHRYPEGTPAHVIFKDPVEAALFSRDAPELQRIRWIAALRSVDARPTYQARQAG